MSKNPVYAQMEAQAMARIVKYINRAAAQHKLALRGGRKLP